MHQFTAMEQPGRQRSFAFTCRCVYFSPISCCWPSSFTIDRVRHPLQPDAPALSRLMTEAEGLAVYPAPALHNFTFNRHILRGQRIVIDIEAAGDRRIIEEAAVVFGCNQRDRLEGRSHNGKSRIRQVDRILLGQQPVVQRKRVGRNHSRLRAGCGQVGLRQLQLLLRHGPHEVVDKVKGGDP